MFFETDHIKRYALVHFFHVPKFDNGRSVQRNLSDLREDVRLLMANNLGQSLNIEFI